MIRQGVVAAVDLGTNSFHMIVAAVEADGSLRILDRLREAVRLGEGINPRRELSEEARSRALASLERLGERLREVKARNVRAVGTNTLREARTDGDFHAACEHALGHPIEVVSGYEEARLVYLGVAYDLGFDDQPRLVVDIGGGSTEMIYGTGADPQAMESVHAGCVTLNAACFEGRALNRRTFDRAVVRARLEFEPVEAGFRNREWIEAVGASGTVRSVAEILATDWGTPPGVIPRDELFALRDRLVTAGELGATEHSLLSTDRRKVFPAGLAILVALFESLGLERLEVSDGALREGLLQDLLGRLGTGDIRERTVTSLARRYHVDGTHAEHVRETALRLFGQLVPDGATEAPWAQRVLGWSARLHEVGLDISHARYHKHGAYILQHSDLAGFSRQEQQLLAVLVQAHRRKIPRKQIRNLPVRWQPMVLPLVTALRLSVLLHRGRAPDARPEPSLEMSDDEVRVTFPDGYLADAPLLRADLEQEGLYLERAGLELRFA